MCDPAGQFKHQRFHDGVGDQLHKEKPVQSVLQEATETLRESDDLAASVQKTENRVKLDSLPDKVDQVQFVQPDIAPHFTIAVVRLKNGFVVTGVSAPADPANYNEAVGQKFALKDAIGKIWPMEGYLLCEKLAAQRYAGAGGPA